MLGGPLGPGSCPLDPRSDADSPSPKLSSKMCDLIYEGRDWGVRLVHRPDPIWSTHSAQQSQYRENDCRMSPRLPPISLPRFFYHPPSPSSTCSPPLTSASLLKLSPQPGMPPFSVTQATLLVSQFSLPRRLCLVLPTLFCVALSVPPLHGRCLNC